MPNVYDGPTDTRQSDQPIPVTRFRPRYRVLTDEEKALHDLLKDKASELENLFAQVKSGSGRYHALAITALEQSVMWIVKDLTS
jgi:hypothetical protein